MFKRIVLPIILAVSTIGIFSSFDDDNNFEISKNLDIYYTLFKELNNLYVDDIDAGKIIKTSIDEMLLTLDPYTTFIPESKMEDFKFMTTGQYGGVGAMIRQDSNYVIVTEVYEGFPADKAGLKAGDAIYEIEGKSAEGMNSEDISLLLKGQPGTTFTIQIKRPNTDGLIEKQITREKIKINSVPYAEMLTDKVGYITLTSFTQNCSQELKKAFDKLKAEGMTSLVLDLRGNPGGLLHESVNIVNMFVDKGQEVVSTRGKFSQSDRTYSTKQPALDTTMKIAVLISNSSASASEIVSGSLQDLDRAVVLGQRSYGKGLVQMTKELTYNTKLKVTTAKYYIPSGRCIQALDYSHRNPDGSVGKVPDSLISAYKTKNGRTVYDGGGIEPDIKIEQEELSILAYELLTEHIIFDYVTEYCQNNESIAEAKSFSLSNSEYESFTNFVKSSPFTYKLESEMQLESLIESAKEESYYGSIEEQIENLKKALATSKEGDLQKHKKEISRIIENEIIGRFYYQKGQIAHQVKEDPEVKEAIDVLLDSDRYDKILAGE